MNSVSYCVHWPLFESLFFFDRHTDTHTQLKSKRNWIWSNRNRNRKLAFDFGFGLAENRNLISRFGLGQAEIGFSTKISAETEIKDKFSAEISNLLNYQFYLVPFDPQHLLLGISGHSKTVLGYSMILQRLGIYRNLKIYRSLI